MSGFIPHLPRLPALRLVFFILAGSLVLSSCTSPEAVADFSSTAQKALRQGSPIFRDIPASCARRHLDAQPTSPIYFAEGGDSGSAGAGGSPVCARFEPQGEALVKASNVLIAYFAAIQQLAAFNTSTVSSDSERVAENSAAAAQLSLTQIDSIGKLAGLITQAFTKRYKRTHLVTCVREADASVASVTRGFEDIVSKDYEGLLREEQQTVTARYQNIGDIQDRALILLLNRAYMADVNDLTRRKTAAEAYVQALEQIRDAHHALAQNAQRLNSKQFAVALNAYTTKLQALVPAAQIAP